MERWAIKILGVCVSSATLLLPFLVSAQTANVTTWHNDNLRTGQNLSETSLAPSNLSTFGQLCSYGVDGQVYSQPLVVTNVTIKGQNYASAVFVVTQNDTLYAFNWAPPATGSTCTLIGSYPFLQNGATNGHSAVQCQYLVDNCQTIAPSDGILGTPVIGPLVPDQPNAKWPIYVVTHTQTGTNPQHCLLSLPSRLRHTEPFGDYHRGARLSPGFQLHSGEPVVIYAHPTPRALVDPRQLPLHRILNDGWSCSAAQWLCIPLRYNGPVTIPRNPSAAVLSNHTGRSGRWRGGVAGRCRIDLWTRRQRE